MESTLKTREIRCARRGADPFPDSAEHKGVEVAFCCGHCAAFQRNTPKFAAKANHQLELTKQAKLVQCPFAGGGINRDTTSDVAFAKGFEIKKPDADVDTVASIEGDPNGVAFFYLAEGPVSDLQFVQLRKTI